MHNQIRMWNAERDVILGNPKFASSYITSALGEGWILDVNSLEINPHLVQTLQDARRIFVLVKEPNLKFASSLVTVFVTELKKFPRMVMKFEQDRKLKRGYTYRLLQNRNIPLDEGGEWGEPLSDEEFNYLSDLYVEVLSRAISDDTIYYDTHLRPHHTFVYTSLDLLTRKYNIDKDVIKLIDISTAPNPKLQDIINKRRLYNHKDSNKLSNTASNGWKDVLMSSFRRLEKENKLAHSLFQKQLDIEDFFYNALIDLYKTEK